MGPTDYRRFLNGGLPKKQTHDARLNFGKIEIIRNRKEFVLNGMVLDGESLTKVSTSVSWK